MSEHDRIESDTERVHFKPVIIEFEPIAAELDNLEFLIEPVDLSIIEIL